MTGERTAHGAYICRGCGQSFRRDEYADPADAVGDATFHVSRCEGVEERDVESSTLDGSDLDRQFHAAKHALRYDPEWSQQEAADD